MMRCRIPDRIHSPNTATIADRSSGPSGGMNRILIDAPCTGLGTVGSRPDLRWRREPADVERLAALQRGMVDFLRPRLAPGGALVLSLCTLGTAEAQAADEHPVEARLELRPDAGAGEGFVAVRVSAAP